MLNENCINDMYAVCPLLCGCRTNNRIKGERNILLVAIVLGHSSRESGFAIDPYITEYQQLESNNKLFKKKT